MGTCFFIGIVVIYKMAILHKLTAGIFTMNNFFQFSFYNKPWNKVSVYALGIMSAMLYIDIKKWKESEGENRFVEFIVRNKTAKNGSKLKTFFPFFVVLCSLCIFYVDLFSAFNIESTPFAWSDSENAVWYALTRPSWALATMSMFFFVITGHCPFALTLITEPVIGVINCMIWPAFLLSPMIYMNMYARVKEAIYMTMLTNCVKGMGGMMFTYISTVVFVMLINYPVETMVTKVFRKNLLGQVFTEKIAGK